MSLLLNTDASSYALPSWTTEICLRLEPGAAATSVQVLALMTSQHKRSPCPTQPLSLFQEELHTCAKSAASATMAPAHAREQCLICSCQLHPCSLHPASSLHHKQQTGSFTNWRLLPISKGQSIATRRCAGWKGSISTDGNTKGHPVAVARGHGRRDPAARLPGQQPKGDFDHTAWAPWHSHTAHPKHCPPQLHLMSTARSLLTPAAPARGQRCPAVAQAQPVLAMAFGD